MSGFRLLKWEVKDGLNILKIWKSRTMEVGAKKAWFSAAEGSWSSMAFPFKECRIRTSRRWCDNLLRSCPTRRWDLEPVDGLEQFLLFHILGMIPTDSYSEGSTSFAGCTETAALEDLAGARQAGAQCAETSSQWSSLNSFNSWDSQDSQRGRLVMATVTTYWPQNFCCSSQTSQCRLCRCASSKDRHMN